MYIDEYIKTAAELVYKDGKKEYTCGMACMLRLVEDAGGPSAFTSIRVHDWNSGEEVDAQTAYYVIGSKVIPDMLPNYIAFATQGEAETFAGKESGEIITFAQALEDISPVGTTSPFRIRTAVTPGKGNFSSGFVYGYLSRSVIKMGATRKDPSNFIKGNRSQPKAPDEFQANQEGLFFNYSLTDDLALFMNVPWFEKRQTTL
ncbi:MAG: nitrous oxide reductase accessory protein NosL, partial [Methanoregulaceae archaeon]|nr:nitrous oxide reductase accessory protein NosL [Methanoregulaceae archaeon]